MLRINENNAVINKNFGTLQDLILFLRSRVQKFPVWHIKPRQMENAVRDT